jgi:ribulose-5-phosphate 4-epimerase/fuculose-1-phosphate aldolase
MKNKEIIVLGGGTFSPVRNHMSICAPAFGTTAKKIYEKLSSDKAHLVLTKMADSSSKLITNEDVSKYIDELIEDKNVKSIILNVAMCDFNGSINNVKSDFHAERLKSSQDYSLHLTPAPKVIDNIRKKRPDIFLVGFKTTTNVSPNDQFLIGLNMMKRSKCNLVLANDTVTRNNIIITPEESSYGHTTNREHVIEELCSMILMRYNLTYDRTNFIEGDSFDLKKVTPESFQKVLRHVIENGGYIENNGNGFTPGHFCYKDNENSFYSSQRKADHNKVFEEGVTKIVVNNLDGKSKFTAYGKRKPSVGARSQWLVLENNKDYDAIIHTHNPLIDGSKIPIANQKPFQCGSLECGINTKDNMGNFRGIKAVYLSKHGANILFKTSDNPENVIKFISENICLGKKVS